MTTKQLTVQNASINTMAIEVKTLTIGARQVTQGIFRQLIEEPLIAEDGALNGVPWGHVTWHPDKCDGAHAHWHIVWQRGEDLRRARVDRYPDFENARGLQDEFECDESAQFINVLVREWLIGREGKLHLDRRYAPVEAVYLQGGCYWNTSYGFKVYGAASTAAVKAAEAKLTLAKLGSAENDKFPWQKTNRESASKTYEENLAELAEIVGDDTVTNARAAYEAAVAAEAARRQRHRDVRAALAQLPQLFIGG